MSRVSSTRLFRPHTSIAREQREPAPDVRERYRRQEPTRSNIRVAIESGRLPGIQFFEHVRFSGRESISVGPSSADHIMVPGSKRTFLVPGQDRNLKVGQTTITSSTFRDDATGQKVMQVVVSGGTDPIEVGTGRKREHFDYDPAANGRTIRAEPGRVLPRIIRC